MVESEREKRKREKERERGREGERGMAWLTDPKNVNTCAILFGFRQLLGGLDGEKETLH